MPFSPQTLEEKPYNKCIPCQYMGLKCDGPNPLAMVKPDDEDMLQRLSEWCRLRKEFLLSHDAKWTNAYIAEQADIAKSTVDKFFAGRLNDIKLSTLARVFKVLVNGSWGEYPCAMDGDEEEVLTLRDALEKANDDIAVLRKELDEMAAKKKHFQDLSKERWEQMCIKDRQLSAGNTHMSERADYLRQKDAEIAAQKKISRRLFSAWCFTILALIFALVSDSILRLF